MDPSSQVNGTTLWPQSLVRRAATRGSRAAPLRSSAATTCALSVTMPKWVAMSYSEEACSRGPVAATQSSGTTTW